MKYKKSESKQDKNSKNKSESGERNTESKANGYKW
jgi:hypothetical protein